MTGLTPPRWWWLMACACAGQGVWALILLWCRFRYDRCEAAAAGIAPLFFLLGGGAGMIYGLLQRDAVLLLGQGTALILGWRWLRCVRAEISKQNHGKQK